MFSEKVLPEEVIAEEGDGSGVGWESHMITWDSRISVFAEVCDGRTLNQTLEDKGDSEKEHRLGGAQRTGRYDVGDGTSTEARGW